jgi:hypothetical protein
LAPKISAPEHTQEAAADPPKFSSVMALRRELWKANGVDEVAQRAAWRAVEPPPTAPHYIE